MSNLPTIDFLLGMLVGCGLTIFLMFIYGTHRGFVAKIHAADQKQKVTQETSKTPSEIVRDADRAKFRLFLFWMTIIFGLFIIFEMTLGLITVILSTLGIL